ncbi:MAG: hypothetical protein LBQ22_09790 [Bacteroidales bacterium]|jgi:hypothetical protein|nr:hypothetical protein [Bacteroidales bacterium]
MKKFYCYILFIFIILPVISVAQNREMANIIATADKEFSGKNYYGAARLYKDALSYDGRMYNIVWSLAEALRMDNDYVDAAIYYRILVDKVPAKYPEAIFYYAMMLKANEDYIRAQYFFNRYINFTKKDEDKILTSRAQKEIFDCEIAWKMYNTPNGYIVEQCDTNINSVYSDFSPGYTKNSVLLFSSIKPLIDSVKYYESKIYFSDFNVPSAKAKLFDTIINKLGYDISNPNLNSAGNKIYFTISDVYNEGNTYIYSSDYINGKWTKPGKLPEKINISGYNSTHPFLVEREKENDILLWSSDRPDGEGGFDIYFCEVLSGNEYGRIINIGRPEVKNELFANFYDTTSVINTTGNEITPYYNTEDSVLYFSSDWHQNMGGYDIFYIKGDFKDWGTVNNIGYPLNSAQNDFYYKIYPEEQIAFLTSNRKAALALSHQSCCNDIFYHTVKEDIDQEEIEQQRITNIITRTKLLVPIVLYFHNDYPNPNSWDTLTTINYSDIYYEYLNMQDNYRKIYSKGLSKKGRLDAIDSIDYYFSYNVQENYNKLLEFSSLMKNLLESGQKVIVTIKGYTSPLNTVEYNNNLAKRRISSLVNFFDQYENGILRQYQQTGLLTYEFVAFGKTLADANVSDDPNDPRNSVYSPAAARERRIEIIAVSIEKIEENPE